jgi:hypothetical protein
MSNRGEVRLAVLRIRFEFRNTGAMLYNMQKDAFTTGTNVFAAKMAGREFAAG